MFIKSPNYPSYCRVMLVYYAHCKVDFIDVININFSNACLKDIDHPFLHSILDCKLRLQIMHMNYRLYARKPKKFSNRASV